MSEAQHEIAVRLGTAFAAIADRFLPAVTEGVERSAKKISFGATVECQLEGTLVKVKLTAHEPKIPTEGMKPIHFVLRREASGQLSFLFDGSLDEMQKTAERMVAESEPTDDYTPDDNASRS